MRITNDTKQLSKNKNNSDRKKIPMDYKNGPFYDKLF